MEIEVGEHIRTKYGDITKVIRYYEEANLYQCKNGMFIDIENNIDLHVADIVKHSKNIIDLIEVGDFVNGHKVNNVSNFEYEIYDDNYDDWITKKGLHLECGDEEGRIIIENKDIKSILTHEQYEQNCYRLEE